jgi:hypothetical protein
VRREFIHAPCEEINIVHAPVDHNCGGISAYPLVVTDYYNHPTLAVPKKSDFGMHLVSAEHDHRETSSLKHVICVVLFHISNVKDQIRLRILGSSAMVVRDDSRPTSIARLCLCYIFIFVSFVLIVQLEHLVLIYTEKELFSALGILRCANYFHLVHGKSCV